VSGHNDADFDVAALPPPPALFAELTPPPPSLRVADAPRPLRIVAFREKGDDSVLAPPMAFLEGEGIAPPAAFEEEDDVMLSDLHSAAPFLFLGADASESCCDGDGHESNTDCNESNTDDLFNHRHIALSKHEADESLYAAPETAVREKNT
jgi:hypothetical protein